jgi:MoaA/NifB/PqqE/SkfB family radical SAM enzyme
MNKTFCTLPWVNISVDPDGSVKPCCVSTDFITKDDGTKFNLGYDNIQDIYNSKCFINIRQKMLNGEPVQGCTRCYEQEKNSNSSHRLTYSNFKIFDYKPTQANIRIQYFDLRFGNLCNLSCRSCNPTASSQIAKETKQISDSILNSFWSTDTVNDDINNWYSTDIFNNNLNNQIENIKVLYLTGGEPTLNENNKRFLEKLIENKKTNINIKFNSNMTALNKQFFDLLDNFSSITFFASIDGYTDIQEWLRYPSNWKTIHENIETVVKKQKYNIIITPVIQVGNLNKLVDLFEYCESYNRQYNKTVIKIDPILLQLPEHFNIKILPKEFKLKCWESIETWYNTKCKYQNLVFKEKLKGIKTLCLEDNFDEVQIKKFKQMNNILDNHRQHFLKNVNPELFEMLNRT